MIPAPGPGRFQPPPEHVVGTLPVIVHEAMTGSSTRALASVRPGAAWARGQSRSGLRTRRLSAWLRYGPRRCAGFSFRRPLRNFLRVEGEAEPTAAPAREESRERQAPMAEADDANRFAGRVGGGTQAAPPECRNGIRRASLEREHLRRRQLRQINRTTAVKLLVCRLDAARPPPARSPCCRILRGHRSRRCAVCLRV